jgi:hypothetical protein
MSFLSILGKISSIFGKVNAVVTPLEPAIAAIPVYGPAFDTILNAVAGVEALFAGSVGAGAAKMAAVQSVVAAVAPGAATPAMVTQQANAIVAALNALQAAAALKPVTTPPATT